MDKNQKKREGGRPYAACLFRNRRFCCLSSLISCSSVEAAMSWSMLFRLRSAGISKRAFFLRMPSPRLVISGCDRSVGLRRPMRVGKARASMASETDHSFCGDVGIEPLLALAGVKSGICWPPTLVKGVCAGIERWKTAALTSYSACSPSWAMGVQSPEAVVLLMGQAGWAGPAA